MSEEKIMNEEVMSEEELEEVAGGSQIETSQDINKLFHRHMLNTDRPTVDQIKQAFNKYGIDAEIHRYDKQPNVYWANGQQMNHEQVWNYINRKFHN